MVMPRSRSRSIESSTWACISRSSRPPHSWMRRSASVDFPWSTCAMMEKLRMRCIERLGRPEGRGARIIALSRTGPVAQRAQQLGLIEPGTAHRDLIEQQHRYLQAVTPLQLRIGVDIEQPDRRQRMPRTQRLEFMQHVFAEPALGTGQQRQRVRGFAIRRAQCRPGPAPAPTAAVPGPPAAPKLPRALALMPKPARPLPRSWPAGSAPLFWLPEISSKIEELPSA